MLIKVGKYYRALKDVPFFKSDIDGNYYGHLLSLQIIEGDIVLIINDGTIQHNRFVAIGKAGILFADRVNSFHYWFGEV